MLDWFDSKALTAYSISCGPALLYNNIFPKHKVRPGAPRPAPAPLPPFPAPPLPRRCPPGRGTVPCSAS